MVLMKRMNIEPDAAILSIGKSPEGLWALAGKSTPCLGVRSILLPFCRDQRKSVEDVVVAEDVDVQSEMLMSARKQQ
jgi:hypothetical protein